MKLKSMNASICCDEHEKSHWNLESLPYEVMSMKYATEIYKRFYMQTWHWDIPLKSINHAICSDAHKIFHWNL